MMPAQPTEPQHVGDVTMRCPVCGDDVAVPVLCEFVPGESGVVTLRCTPNVAPVHDHARGHRRARLSRLR